MRKTSLSKQKKRVKKNKRLRLVLVVLVLGYVSSVLISQQIEFAGKRKALRLIAEQINEQAEIKESLDRKYDMVQSREYLEKAAREQLGFARPDEIIFYDTTLKK